MATAAAGRVISLLRLATRRPALVQNVRGYGTRQESKPWRQEPNRKIRLALILTEDVPNLGQRGQLVRVKRGYGRNWLLPQHKAVYATPENKELYGITEQEQDAVVETDVATYVRDVFEKHEISLHAPSGDREWSLHEHDVANALKRLRLHVPLDCIQLPSESPLTSIGAHHVTLHVDEETEISFTVHVLERDSSPKVSEEYDFSEMNSSISSIRL